MESKRSKRSNEHSQIQGSDYERIVERDANNYNAGTFPRANEETLRSRRIIRCSFGTATSTTTPTTVTPNHNQQQQQPCRFTYYLC